HKQLINTNQYPPRHVHTQSLTLFSTNMDRTRNTISQLHSHNRSKLRLFIVDSRTSLHFKVHPEKLRVRQLRWGRISITALVLVVVLVQSLAYVHAAVTAAETRVELQHAGLQQSGPSDNWSTYHRDTFRSGYDPTISSFTAVNLHWKSSTLDGDVYAEPLVVGTDVVVATEENSVYELNANTGQTMWHINLGTPVNGGVLPCGDINPSGITSTPAIDVSGGTIFVVAFLSAPSLHHELFGIDLDT